MLSTRARGALVALLVVVVAACAGGEALDTPAPQAPAPTTSLATATTTPPSSTTTSQPPTTTTDDGLVGDPEALRESFEELERLIAADVTYDEPVPIPDLTNPDPVVALAEAFRFEVWVMENGPHVSWVEGYNYPESPRFRSAGTDVNLWFMTETRFPGIVDTYHFIRGEVVPIEQALLGEDQLAALPDGSVAVAFRDRGGAYPKINSATGERLEEIGAWAGSGVAVLVPTPTGWQLFNEEREEVPAGS
jgi:hypothetical protein